MKLTDPALGYVSSTLKEATAQMQDDERRVALECFKHYRKEWVRIEHEAIPESVAFSIHNAVDDSMRRMLATSEHAPNVQCRKGCAACCHVHVDVFPQEAQLLLMLAHDDGIEIDYARLARQATKNADTWRELSIEDQRCVFLGEDRACRVYEHRPGNCRKYLVVTEPDLCDMNKHPGGKVGKLFSLEAEIQHSAAMTVYGADNLAKLLLEGIKP